MTAFGPTHQSAASARLPVPFSSAYGFSSTYGFSSAYGCCLWLYNLMIKSRRENQSVYLGSTCFATDSCWHNQQAMPAESSIYGLSTSAVFLPQWLPLLLSSPLPLYVLSLCPIPMSSLYAYSLCLPCALSMSSLYVFSMCSLCPLCALFVPPSSMALFICLYSAKLQAWLPLSKDQILHPSEAYICI